MNRWFLIAILICLVAPTYAAVEIIDLPDAAEEPYDLTWEMTVNAPLTTPLLLNVEQGYQLRLTATQVSWEQTGKSSTQVKAAVRLDGGKHYTLVLKRRPDTVALLVNHRLALCAPAPALGQGKLAFRQVPAGVTIDSARYRNVGRIALGDDFMRPESQTRLLVNPNSWVEDDTWKVAYYRKDNPGADPRDPKTNAPLVAPWQLSIFNNYMNTTTTNGFWFLYRGVGPSWVIANPTQCYPSWDQYFVEASVRPEYDSAIGLIAAYQDNKNYLLFRWQQREYVPSGTPLAQMIAVVDGKQQVIATNLTGFDPMQWYRLRINLGWKSVQALVDGKVLMEAQNPGGVEGRVGLYADGAASPNRPKVDDLTASMYVSTDEKTGRTINEAADALRTNSMVYFDDVRVGNWLAVPDAVTDGGYPVERTGKWNVNDGVIEARNPGRLLSGSYSWGRYTAATRVKIPRNGYAGLFIHMTPRGDGYVWVLTPEGQKLQPVKDNTWQREVDRSSLGLQPGEWGDLRVEADGSYLALYFNNQLVMEHYDPAHTAGRCGLLAPVNGVQFSALSVTMQEPKRHTKVINDAFNKDKWLVTWSSAEADWYPSFPPRAYVTPAGMPHAMIGAAAPLPTDQAGLYWHKGGHYHDLRVTIPASTDLFAGQILHLSSNYDGSKGYRVLLGKANGQGTAKLQRDGGDVGDYPFKLTAKSQLVFARRGSYLLLSVQDLDPEQSTPSVVAERLVFAYKDPEPLKASMIGFTVTTPSLPAANVQVESDRIEDTFEAAPSGWLTESGVWAVMARYSCQPQWNWFGGFGVNTPTVWSKYRLDGDQIVEVYMGIKMQYDNMPEEYARRYRDVNVTICSDGSHLSSGYSLIRAGRAGNQQVTMLLRKGLVVKTSSLAEHLLPQKDQGHREWFATRLEKRGGEIKVYLDNKLAMTYTDPDPLPGGYMGVWTLNNGIMLGRANLSAEKITLGTPRAAAPLAVQQILPPQTAPSVNIAGAPVTPCTFETDMDGWKERAGITARLLRERVTDAARGTNTYLKVINMYPAGDFSVSACSTPRDLTATPFLHFDYCFDPGVQINLYVRKDNTWYEFLLSGKEAQEPNVYTVGPLPTTADGNWRHQSVNLGAVLKEVIAKQTGKTPDNTTVQEIIFADWSTSPDMRQYGFGSNRGGLAARFDNFVLMPAVKDTTTLAWQKATNAQTWRTSIDTNPFGMPNTESANLNTTVEFQTGTRYFHLQAKEANGKWGPMVSVPIIGAK